MSTTKISRWARPRMLFATVVALLIQAPSNAEAFTYSGEYVSDWNGCDPSCSGAGTLRYTDDQIADFDSRMASLGQIRRHLYGNQGAWASDLSEDRLGGQDELYSDDSDIVAYSGHGSAPTDSGGETFRAPLCHANTMSSCWFDAKNARFGERSGYYSSPYPGTTRWLMWLACYSVDTAPQQQWGEAFYAGLEYVMGYRGTSADSPTTVEVPGDWADEAIGSGSSLKAAWFYAIEDWWVNDTGEVASTGPDAATADYRRDWLSTGWPRRAANDYGSWVSWSWHEG